MPSTPLRNAVPLGDLPRHARPLLVGYGLAVAALVALTVVTGAVGAAYWFDEAYEVVLPSVAFVLPVLAGLACAALGGGLVPSLALGAAPSLAWAVAVVLGRGLGTLLGTPLPIPDSPLWAIAGAFLLVGLVGALAGFLGGRVGRLAWRRIAA